MKPTIPAAPAPPRKALEVGPAGAQAAGDARLSRAGRTRALVDLLADDSPTVQEGVRNELDRLGRTVEPALRRAASRGEPAVRGRVRQILIERARRRSLRRLLRFAAKAEPNLESALFLLGAALFPEEDARPFRRALDVMGDELARRIAKLPPGDARIDAFIEYLGRDMGFAGAEDDYHHPDNLHLGRAIERRQGMPLTVCAIYLYVARRAGIHAGLLPFPGHVLLSVKDGGERRIVDAFAGGKELSVRHCLAYLAQHRFPYREEWFKEATDSQMFGRHLANAIHCLESRGRQREMRDLKLVGKVLFRASNP